MNKSFLFLLAFYTIIISSLPCQDDIFKSWHQQSDFEVALEMAHSSENESMGLGSMLSILYLFLLLGTYLHCTVN